VDSIGALILCSSHRIAGFGMSRLAVGGMISDLKIEHTLETDARKDMISRWPMLPFMLPTNNSSSLLNSDPTQLASMGSPTAVPVACNST